MDNEKLHQFALNQLTDKSEIEEVVTWIEASTENRETFNTLKNLWAISGFGNYDTYLDSTDKKLNRKSHGRIVHMGLVKYAAIFILAFFIGGLSIYQFGFRENYTVAFNEITVPAGESAEVLLPDHTRVSLNSGSKLVYPAVFSKKNRDVKLSGEAYFEVSHNPRKPFQVITPSLTVEVVGTSFNVEAFNQSGDVNVTLVEGKVNLKNNEGKILAGLVPGENARFDLKQKNIHISNVETEVYTSWKDGFLLFKEEKLADIAKKFERWFNVKVVFKDETLKNKEFTGTILKNKPIDQILDVLKYTSDISYSIELKNNEPSIIYLDKNQ